MRLAILIVCATAVVAPVSQEKWSTPEIDIYRAVLRHTILPETAKFSAGAGISPNTRVLVFDRTLVLCSDPPVHPKEMGCISLDRTVGAFEGTLPRRSTPVFGSAIDASTRAQLATSFREQNRQERLLPVSMLPIVTLVPPERLDQVATQEAPRTRGFSALSSPALSSNGHALVYGYYVCGSLCGYGWFFLLQQQGESWQVVSREMLWIS
jgi:hypothetical protein